MKIITHTDFDGVCCAALFLRKFSNEINIEYFTVDEAKKLSDTGIIVDYTCDLPKIGNSINFDHHKSNYEDLVNSGRLTEKDHVDPNAPSATELVFQFLNFEDDPIALEIRNLGNLADTARLPEEYRPLDIILNLNNDDQRALQQISELLSKLGSNILSTDWVQKKYNESREIFNETQKKISEFIDSVPIFPRILVLDTRGSIPGKLAKEVFTPLFKRNVAVIALVYSKSHKESIRVSFRVTKLNNEQDFYDVSIVAKTFKGGGHRMAAACTPTPKDIPTNLIRELNKIAKPNDDIKYFKM
ncbi:MAG: DHHA1 domain-containing protein [Candidatus Hodarchaeota archaeon]